MAVTLEGSLCFINASYRSEKMMDHISAQCFLVLAPGSARTTSVWVSFSPSHPGAASQCGLTDCSLDSGILEEEQGVSSSPYLGLHKTSSLGGQVEPGQKLTCSGLEELARKMPRKSLWPCGCASLGILNLILSDTLCAWDHQVCFIVSRPTLMASCIFKRERLSLHTT